ncbi:MAG TPA: Lrp/AsnC family transcriptional regulator [Candidatus Nanoarchaeia archaeon]|nr:Lrp/AsnC family transcriptional regulator [Candidatus Nanoarchaeia archaeon]
MAFDETDKKLINALLLNSKLSYRELAKEVNVSVATAMHRVKRLENEKVIKRYTTIIDYDKAGFDVEVLVEMRISKGKLFQVEKEIANHPNVFAVYDLTGDFDAAILARFQNRKAMDSFLKKIQTYDFVERTNTRLILNTIKEKEIGLR